mgnify:CR=1 FL=1
MAKATTGSPASDYLRLNWRKVPLVWNFPPAPVPHPLFKPKGADLKLDFPVSLDDAVLGAKIAVPTLSGKVQVTIPANSSSGRVLQMIPHSCFTRSSIWDSVCAA